MQRVGLELNTRRHVGTFGDVGCFSFHPRKAITTEGGMVTTNKQSWQKKFAV